MKKTIFSVFIIIIIILVSAYSWWNSRLDPVNSGDKSTKSIVVAKGQGVNEIAVKLEKEGLIRSASAFTNYVQKEGLESKIQTGSFKVSPSLSGKEIARMLTTQPGDTWVTLLEGWRVEEMAEKLNKELGISKEEFIKKSEEGYMFPDTYLFPKEVTVDYVVNTLRDTFDQRYSDEIKNKIKKLGLTAEQGVILASIVEREARSAEVRKKVASILLKRLNIDMGINADATIQYALGYQLGDKTWWKKRILYEDLKVDSPYNTYLHVGLPPKPIANPSLSALNAVANADPNTPYLYYFHDTQGNSYYGRTLEEHNRNVENHQ